MIQFFEEYDDIYTVESDFVTFEDIGKVKQSSKPSIKEILKKLADNQVKRGFMCINELDGKNCDDDGCRNTHFFDLNKSGTII